MSDKVELGVIDTLAGALRFAAYRFPTVIKIAFLPSLLLYVPIIWITATSFGGMMELIPSLVDQDGAGELSDEQTVEFLTSMAPLFLAMALLVPLSLLYAAMVGVPLSRAIVLDEKPGFFRLDGIVWRYFFGQIVMALLMIGILLAIFGVAAAAIVAAGGIENPPAVIAIGFLALWLYVFVVLRLSLFMVEIAVSGKFGVRAAFRKTRGNVMRLIGAGLLFIVLLIVLQIAFEVVFYLFGAIALAANFNALEVATEAEDVELLIDALKGMIVSPVGGIFAGVFAIYTLFITGLQVAFPAMIYRNLGGGRQPLELVAEK